MCSFFFKMKDWVLKIFAKVNSLCNPQNCSLQSALLWATLICYFLGLFFEYVHIFHLCVGKSKGIFDKALITCHIISKDEEIGPQDFEMASQFNILYIDTISISQ